MSTFYVKEEIKSDSEEEIKEIEKENQDTYQAERHAKIFGYTPDLLGNMFLKK